jgi:hypothetical protein
MSTSEKHEQTQDEDDCRETRQCLNERPSHRVFVDGEEFRIPFYECEGQHLDFLDIAYNMSMNIKSPKSALTVVRVLRKTFITRAMLNVNDQPLAAEYVLGIIDRVCQDGMSHDLVEEVINSGMLISFKASAKQVVGAPYLRMCSAVLNGASVPSQIKLVVSQLKPMLLWMVSNITVNDIEDVCRMCERVSSARTKDSFSIIEAVCQAVDYHTDGMTPTASVVLFAACDMCKYYDFAHYVADGAEKYINVCSGRFLLDAIRLVAGVSNLPVPNKVSVAAILLIEHADVGERWLEIRCCLTPNVDVLSAAARAVGARSRDAPGTLQAAVVCALVAANVDDMDDDALQQEILGMIAWAAENEFGPPDEVVRMMYIWSQRSPQWFSTICDTLVGCPALCAFLNTMTTRDAQLLLELEVA